MSLRFILSPEDEAIIGTTELNQLASVYADFFAPASVAIEVSLVDNPTIQGINLTHRGINESTDVLSFPLFDNLEAIKVSPETESLIGSIVISPEKAGIYGESLPQLLHHGLLHLAGLDHETNLAAWRGAELPLLSTLAEAGLVLPSIPYESL